MLTIHHTPYTIHTIHTIHHTHHTHHTPYTGISSFLAGHISSSIRTADSNVLDKLALASTALWQILICSAIGLSLSFTGVRALDGCGMSRIAGALLYLLVGLIGMNLDIRQVHDRPLIAP
jgi:uncharacterized membrane protein